MMEATLATICAHCNHHEIQLTVAETEVVAAIILCFWIRLVSMNRVCVCVCVVSIKELK